MPAEWLLGVGLCLAGAAFTNLGLTLQKLSFLRIDALNLPPHKQPSCLQPLWLLGFTLFLVGQAAGMVAMGFSSQSVVATLGSFSLVTNAIFAPLILGEQLTWMLVVSIVVIMSGSAIVVLSSNHSNQDYTLQQLLDLFHHDLFTVYASLLAFCLLLCVIQMVREHRRYVKEQRRTREADSPMGGNVVLIDDRDSINVPISMPPSPRKPLLSPSSSFGSIPSSPSSSPLSPPSPLLSPPSLSSLTPTLTAAILSSISVLLGKCCMQLIKTSVTTPDNQFHSPLSYLITAIFLTAAVASVHLLNVGLRRGTALFVVPFYYVASTSLAIGGGLVYFEEFKEMGWLQCVVFFGGVGLTVLGVWISTRGQMEEEEREREEEEEVEGDEQAEAVEEAEAQSIPAEEEDEAAKAVDGEEHKSSQSSPRRALPTLPLSSASPTSPSSRTTQPSPRSFTPRQPAIAEEDVLTSPPVPFAPSTSAVEEAEEEEREVSKRRAWHAKRAVSEPGISFIMTTPTKADQPPVEQYGTFTSSTSPATTTQSSSSTASPSQVSTTLSRATVSSSSARLGRTQSLSLSLGDVTSHSALARHQLSRARTARPSLARRSYTPHYTLAWYPVLPSNPPTARRKQRSVSAAGSRHLSPSGTPTRRLKL